MYFMRCRAPAHCQKMVGSVPASGVGGNNALSCQNEGTNDNDNDKNETKRNQMNGTGNENENRMNMGAMQFEDRASFGLVNCRCFSSYSCLYPLYLLSSYFFSYTDKKKCSKIKILVSELRFLV